MSAVAVVGLGLMGGSLLRALSSAGRRALAWGPDPAERGAAGRLPGIDAPPTLVEALERANGVVLATPLSALGEILDAMAVRPRSSWITDVASLQGPPLAAAAARGLEDVYVSSHPMVGGHRSGFGAGRAELYDGAKVWVSAPAEVPLREAVVRFWRGIGAEPVWVDARDHDQRMARVSHLPQVVSTHLAALLAEAGLSRAELGPGGRDVTRLAGSDPRMWRDILAAGSSPLPDALRTLATRLVDEADRLEGGDADGFGLLLESTRAWSAG